MRKNWNFHFNYSTTLYLISTIRLQYPSDPNQGPYPGYPPQQQQQQPGGFYPPQPNAYPPNAYPPQQQQGGFAAYPNAYPQQGGFPPQQGYAPQYNYPPQQGFPPQQPMMTQQYSQPMMSGTSAAVPAVIHRFFMFN